MRERESEWAIGLVSRCFWVEKWFLKFLKTHALKLIFLSAHNAFECHEWCLWNMPKLKSDNTNTPNPVQAEKLRIIFFLRMRPNWIAFTSFVLNISTHKNRNDMAEKNVFIPVRCAINRKPLKNLYYANQCSAVLGCAALYRVLCISTFLLFHEALSGAIK